MPASLTIRSAGLADIDAVVSLVHSAYRGDTSRRGWTTEADLLDGQRTDAEEIRTLIETAGSRILLAHADSRLVGCLWLAQEGALTHLGMFAVNPSEQAQGVGKVLLAEAERITREELGLCETELSVITLRTELIAWYERRGYVRTGELQAFPYGNARFGLPRRSDLGFEVMRKHLL